MLGRVQRGGGPRVNAELGGDVPNVVVGRARRDEQCGGDLLLGRAGAEQTQHVHLARGHAGRSGAACGLLVRGGEDGLGRLPVQLAFGDSSTEPVGGRRGGEGAALRACRGEGTPGVGCGQDPGGVRDLGGDRAPVVARTVEVLVVQTRDPGERPTAVIYGSDVMAASGLSAALEHGLHVAVELSVLSWDDSQLATLMRPALTALRRDNIAYGALAGGCLLDLIEGRNRGLIQLPTSDLVVRGSTAAAPG